MRTCTRKVLCTVAEKHVTPDLVVVDIMKGEGKRPSHLARQPLGQVPVLEAGAFRPYESRAIRRYLDETLGGTPLAPKSPQARGHMEP